MRLALLLMMMSALLVACSGWQLRGSHDPALLVQSDLAIEGNLNNDLEQLLLRSFRGDSQSQYLVRMLSDRRLERIETLTARLHQGVVRIQRDLTYELVDRQGHRVAQGEARVWRDLEVNESNPAATEREKNLLDTEMNRDILNQLLGHLERFRDDTGT